MGIINNVFNNIKFLERFPLKLPIINCVNRTLFMTNIIINATNDTLIFLIIGQTLAY